MIFGASHIVLTAAITSVLALIVAFWRLPRTAWLDILTVTVLSGVAVLLWRLSANMPQLNDDGLPGFSANDWAAPALTYLLLSVFTDLRAPADPGRYRQTRALATLGALAVNVITI
ncbi:MAG: hypothetical protein ABR615_00340 [Pseudonocardiaceae bacterium]